MSSKMNSKQRLVRCPKCLNVLPEPPEVPLYTCGGCGATLQAKKRIKSKVDSASQKPDDDSSGKRKVLDQVLDDQEAGSSSSNQKTRINSTHRSDQNSDHDDDTANKANVDEHDDDDDDDDDDLQSLNKDAVIEYLYGKQKKKHLSDVQQSPINSMDEPNGKIHNDPRSSTELSGNEDPESSPEATGHNRINQEQEQNQKRDQENTTVDAALVDIDQNSELSYHDDRDQEFLSCRHDTGFEESGSEFEEANANSRNVRDSDGGSKSSFKTLIAEKLLDTRKKKAVFVDEEDVSSVDISSVETTETARFDGTGYYGYGGSASSSFDTFDNQLSRKHVLGSMGSETVDTGHRFTRRNLTRNVDTGHRFHGLNEVYSRPKHGSRMISENPKLERIELLKRVKELEDQLERANISSPSPQHVSLYNNHVFNSPGRYNRRMAFSGEATAVNRPCHHCFPQDRRFSAQLPRQHVCSNSPQYMPNTYYNPRFSGPSSPIYPTPSDSEFPASDGYIHRNRDATKPVHSPRKKRYVRPIASGSPWIICYHCSKLLELPQSFLVFNKKCHTLRCGACFKTLNFTLSNGSHVSRYYPEETITAPPSSEVEDLAFDEASGSRDSRVSRAGPVSCSDVSFQKSYSTETDRNGSWELTERRRKGTVSRDPSGSTQPSSSKISGRRKMTSETEVDPRPDGSPLHRLMGYPSPSKVIRG